MKQRQDSSESRTSGGCRDVREPVCLLAMALMKLFVAVVLVSMVAAGCRTRETPIQVNGPAEAEEHPYGLVYHVTCVPAYYKRADDDCLVPAKDAQHGPDFNAVGIVLRVVSPKSQEGKVMAFHFDIPEKWNHWYKPDRVYAGKIHEREIGTMTFRCDPGLREVTNSLPKAPNKGRDTNDREGVRP